MEVRSPDSIGASSDWLAVTSTTFVIDKASAVLEEPFVTAQQRGLRVV